MNILLILKSLFEKISSIDSARQVWSEPVLTFENRYIEAIHIFSPSRCRCFHLRHIRVDQGIQERWWWETPSIGWGDQGGE